MRSLFTPVQRSNGFFNQILTNEQTFVLGLVKEGLVDALRIDHPDGLSDPLQYFERLRDGGAQTVWIEKILEASEPLRDWPVAGLPLYPFRDASPSRTTVRSAE